MYPSPHVRVSDADREAIVAQLSAATAEGRLSIEEFSERSRYAYASRTWGELSTVVYDLPAAGLVHVAMPGPPPPAPSESKLPMLALMAGFLLIPLFLCGGGGMLAPFSSIAAIVLGVKALRGPAKHVRHGRKMAITGLILGTLGLLGTATVVAGLLSGFLE
ncbi:DUF1707 domain-containing protein [Actinoplanes sp. L3-i22]|uniref:DUF1707 SHOCT-like domain-containing protein n=1 Tax=Actinoplanes sp. L3-i22 TaxID=2836373 RepID=UPI001C8458DF|nr:DUF1707 domain-containing protein [Actinoplanes sp. L3-i22]